MPLPPIQCSRCRNPVVSDEFVPNDGGGAPRATNYANCLRRCEVCGIGFSNANRGDVQRLRKFYRDAGPEARAGSRRCLQLYVGSAPDELSDLIVAHSPTLASYAPTRLEWRSPIVDGNYAEHRDDFLEILGLHEYAQHRRRFWPNGGPVWDGLATISSPSGAGILLVEAKAYPAEAHTRCTARNQASVKQIEAAFATVQTFMGTRKTTPNAWMEPYYQAANRLAYLYLLNEVMKKPTWLAFINFIDDESNQPTSLRTWLPDHSAMFQHLGLHPGCRLMQRIITLFVKPHEVGQLA